MKPLLIVSTLLFGVAQAPPTYHDDPNFCKRFELQIWHGMTEDDIKALQEDFNHVIDFIRKKCMDKPLEAPPDAHRT